MRTALLVVCVVSLAGCSGGGSERDVAQDVSGAGPEMAHSVEPVSGERVVLWVEGLSCPQCATNIDLQLERLSGVEDIRVDLGAGKVDVDLGGERKPSPRQLADAVADAGFTLLRIEVAQ